MTPRTQSARRPGGTPFALSLIVAASLALLLAGCGGGDSSASGVPVGGSTFSAPATNMGFPGSLTGSASGGGGFGASSAPVAEPAAAGGPLCHFAGQDEADPLRNGYVMTRWLVGNMAGWLCLSDVLGHTASLLVRFGVVPMDGTLVDIGDPGKPDDPTGLSVLRAGGQTTIKLYFHNNPQPGLFLSWAGSGATLSGRLVVIAANVTLPPPGNLAADPEAPTHMRLDFARSGGVRTAKMYMAFDPYNEFAPPSWDNPWATGFRIDATKTLATGNFEISGLITTKAQIDPNYGAFGAEVPQLRLYAVSDTPGRGASIADIVDLGLELRIDADDTIGFFRFDKEDRYYFLSNGTAEWFNRDVTAGDYKGGESYVGWSDSMVDTALSITGGTTAGCKAANGADCVTLLNAVFDNGPWGFDFDPGGGEPVDARQTALNSAVYLTQATPDASPPGDWTGVFDMTFTP